MFGMRTYLLSLQESRRKETYGFRRENSGLVNGTKQIIQSTVACWFLILFLARLPYICSTEPKLITFLQSTTVSPTIQTPDTPTDVYSNSYISLRFQRLMTNTYYYSRSFALGDFEQTQNKFVFLATKQQILPLRINVNT